MMFFNTRKPRPFHHTYIYVDEHKDRVNQIEQHARQELSMEQPSRGDEASRRKSLHEAFAAATPHVARHKRRGLSTVMWGPLLLIVLMLLLCYVLMSV